jgi:hypothetical protein
MGRQMISQVVWGVTLALLALIGLWAAGSGKSWGWFICLTSEFVWVGYALAIKQYALFPSVAIFTIVYFRNWIHIRRQEKVEGK